MDRPTLDSDAGSDNRREKVRFEAEVTRKN
jgi:hypothetical protein